ncbi:MAG: hypothetical protein H7Y02_07840 [Candidatus Obscuribacterales bacterium]|nr:hypothetical protein [Steroidobacteraceae bacterium]
MTEQVAKLGKIRKLERIIAAAVVVAIAGVSWGYFENRRGGHLNRALGSANSQIALQQQLIARHEEQIKSQATKLSDVAKKNLPIAVLFRPIASGNGLAAFFKNNAPTPIEIGVVLSNPITDRRREVNLVIPPNGAQSIGEAEGWVFGPGHVIRVTHAQFGTSEYVVP